MADAAGAAPREVFSYAYAGAHADAAATFAARGSMELFFSTDVDGAEMDNLLPADFPIKRCGGGLSSIAYGDFAKVILPILSVSPGVANLAVGASFFAAEAWSRWWGALQALMAAHTGRQREYPGYMQRCKPPWRRGRQRRRPSERR
ncbi:hypothetical protein AB1Y20_015573 [Prymnesium parvum]|uniref:Uncharacterized protein n=1 Tax=Prymnesium parvum TaxID=97485 RepID=A0AB34K0L6_PRYPA